jgi:hypothetical protein
MSDQPMDSRHLSSQPTHFPSTHLASGANFYTVININVYFMAGKDTYGNLPGNSRDLDPSHPGRRATQM